MDDRSSLSDYLSQRGISRRDFIKFCGVMTAALGLPLSELTTISEALAAAPRPRVVWLEFQDCTGDTESFLRAARRTDPIQSSLTDPNVTSLLLEVLSLEYHETLMAPSGFMADKTRTDVVNNYPGQYICVVEGSIPTGAGGAYCTIGGRTALSIAQQVCGKAKATIALGTCAASGGLPGAAPNPTGAVGVKQALPGLQNLILLPGCPANGVNLVATIVNLVTYGKLPEQDASGQAKFAYGGDVIHEDCPRKDFYEENKFVLAWGDAGHRQGWCLYKMGCRGPVTHQNCGRVKWNDGTSWCLQSGQPCAGCSTANFWDKNTPFYNLGPRPD